MASCILYQISESTIILIDVPRSIEIAQGTAARKLLSSKPLESPFPSVEPKSEKARANLGEISLDGLLVQKHIQLSLDQLKSEWKDKWCLPRQVKCEVEGCENERAGRGTKRKKGEREHQDTITQISTEESNGLDSNGRPSVRIPPYSTVLIGDITSTSHIFLSHAPKFNLIVLDPPWPNRSARRKKSYGISYGNHEIRTLLSSIPLTNYLAEDAFVGIWVTNKLAFREMVLGGNGLFEEWGVHLVEEWIWLKVTSSGEPISELSSMWRKPYEIFLVGKKGVSSDEDVKRRVLVGVPDLHSRKPNLKTVFERVMKKEKYEALEVFARNLTAGWWAWGNEVLKFQSEEYWIEDEH
ncbi:MT-A70-domain-containing protein [Hyaloscypha variabilis F]|uniref:MT-A70-domain-containing protein n=1 Tax=Hyaloscypha variabilis (strain UAMH 11265 / GT02V1 / F) TaxID=1149755 RepID=A0A2J6QUK4_HYAVF|nr:MT-A70-domain-containing protein [Hyaloscypha variabilis F]